MAGNRKKLIISSLA